MLTQRAALAPVAARARVLPLGNGFRATRPVVLRRYKEGEQADTSEQGSKAPKNPITGERLTPISSEKEGYQATEVNLGESSRLRGSDSSDIRINQQLGAQPGGRPFGEMQAFDGLGPEVVNSRLAMLGFAVAAFFELTQGIDVFQQVKNYPLLTIATFVIFTSASWIPFLQGQSYNVKSGPFTPALEVTVGRIAMIGFLGLVLTEAYVTKGPFFPHLF